MPLTVYVSDVSKGSIVPSPFISISSSLMRAFHLSLKMGPNAAMAIFDLRKIAQNGTSIERANDLSLRPNCRYVGGSELLVWGKVDSSAIINIVPLSQCISTIQTIALPEETDPFQLGCLFETESLSIARRQIKLRNQSVPMSYRLGVAIGSLIRFIGLPPAYFESGLWIAVLDWGFKGPGDHGQGIWKNNSSWLEGAFIGYQRKLSDCPMSLAHGGNVNNGAQDNDENEGYLPSQAGIGGGNFEDLQDPGPAKASAFFEELYEAVANAMPDVQMRNTDAQLGSALNGRGDEQATDPTFLSEQNGRTNFNHLWGSTRCQLDGYEEGSLWTGM